MSDHPRCKKDSDLGPGLSANKSSLNFEKTDIVANYFISSKNVPPNEMKIQLSGKGYIIFTKFSKKVEEEI